LIWKFFEAKRLGYPTVEIWGTGKPIREWLYVEDAAEGIFLAGEKYNEIDPLNIAVGSGLSITDLANLIKKIVGYDGNLVYRTEMPDGAPKKVLGISRMKQKLDWVPPTSLEDGISKTVGWLDENYDRLKSRIK
jgi:GDP-L-fucose synthase